MGSRNCNDKMCTFYMNMAGSCGWYGNRRRRQASLHKYIWATYASTNCPGYGSDFWYRLDSFRLKMIAGKKSRMQAMSPVQNPFCELNKGESLKSFVLTHSKCAVHLQVD